MLWKLQDCSTVSPYNLENEDFLVYSLKKNSPGLAPGQTNFPRGHVSSLHTVVHSKLAVYCCHWQANIHYDISRNNYLFSLIRW